jgi:hypothetical protein
MDAVSFTHNTGRHMQRAAIIIKDPHQQYEGLRTSVGLYYWQA